MVGRNLVDKGGGKKKTKKKLYMGGYGNWRGETFGGDSRVQREQDGKRGWEGFRLNCGEGKEKKKYMGPETVRGGGGRVDKGEERRV